MPKTLVRIKSSIQTQVETAPKLSLVADQTIDEMVFLSLTADTGGSASSYQCHYDTSVDAMVASATLCNTLSGLSFNTNTGQMSWTPSYSQAGVYELKITAINSVGTDSEIFTVTVNNVDAPPVLDAVSATSTTELVQIMLNMGDGGDDFDADGDTLTYSCYYDQVINSTTTTSSLCSTLPGMSFSSSTGILIWTPSAVTSTQIYEFGIVASEGNLVDDVVFTITVNDIGATPIDQLDDDNTASGFGGGIHLGTNYSAGVLTLNTTSSYAELNESWTPRWADIVSYWKFDEGAWTANASSTIIDHVGANAGTPRGNAQATSTVRIGNYAGAFDGTSDYVEIPDSVSLDTLTSKITISLWLKFNVVADSCLLDKYIAGGWNFCYQTGYFYLYVTGGMAVKSLPGLVNTNRWHHIMVNYDDVTGNGKLYLDGIDVTELTSAQNLQANNNILALGASASSAFSFNGALDDIAIWNVALTDDEMLFIYDWQKAKYQAQFKSRVIDSGNAGSSWANLDWTSTLPFGKELPDGGGAANSESSADYTSLSTSTLMQDLILLFHLNETATSAGINNDFIDQSASNMRGELDGSITLGREGLFGKAPYFPGTGHILISQSNNANGFATTPSGYSVSLWAKRKPLAAGNKSLFGLSWDYSNSLTMLANGDLLNGTATWSGVFTDTTKFHHIVMVVPVRGAASPISLYFDGKFMGTYSTDTSSAFSRSAIGNCGNASCNNFEGWIDEFAIWGRALSSIEVLQLYRRGVNRIKYQVRTCATANCSDQDALTGDGWMGPGGNFLTYFSELYNNSAITSSCAIPQACYANEVRSTGSVLTGPASLSFADFGADGISVSNNQYFQYRAIMESDDEVGVCSASSTCMPELKSVEIGPGHSF